MIRLRALDLLEENGKTKYWLYMQLGMSYQNFNKMVNNETKSIKYDNIETMCRLFNCTPTELFEITDDWDVEIDNVDVVITSLYGVMFC